MLTHSLEISHVLILLSLLACSVGCASSRSAAVGVRNETFGPCPPSPNCVCSDAIEKPHAIAPLAFSNDSQGAWQTLLEVVRGMPRTKIITTTDNYLHAECRTMVFRFVDDLECHFRPKDNVIAIRSASRIGHSDFGVNRRRLEKIRKLFQDARE